MSRETETDRRKKLVLRTVFGIFLVCVVFYISFMLFSNTSDRELLVNNDTSQLPTHKDFIGLGGVFNIKLPTSFTFVNDDTSLLDNYFGKQLFEYKSSAGVYKYIEGGYTVAGFKCSQQQLIRFTFCDSSDKSSCDGDIFSKLWLVNSAGDYPNFKDYYTKDQTFYYTYSCYESDKYAAITVPDSVEKRYLYDSKCISSQDSNWKNGEDYFTEEKCLAALEEQKQKEETKTCSVRTYDDYTCMGDRLYQKERQSDCDIAFTEYVQKCEYGCDDGACLDKPEKTCSYFEYDDYTCIDGVEYQKVRQRDCSEGYTLEVDVCGQDPIDDENETDTNNENQNQTMDPAPIEKDEEEDSILTCKSYEKVDGTKCKTDYISLLKSTDSVKDFYNDKPLEVAFIIVIILAVIGIIITVIVPTGGKKK